MAENKAIINRKPKAKRDPKALLAPLAVLVIIIIALEIGLRVFDVPSYVMPLPVNIFLGTIEQFHVILPDMLFTIKMILIGYIVAVPTGILLAAVFSQIDLVVKATRPLIICLTITPMITLIPLMTLWMGTDPNLRVIIVIIQAVPIICLNTLNGFTTVEQEKLELARSVGANKLQTFVYVTFMNAMPQVFTGVKLGCIFSTIGAIGADFVGGIKGMGTRIQFYTGMNATAVSYGCILLVALIGLILYYTVEAIERRVIIWKK